MLLPPIHSACKGGREVVTMGIILSFVVAVAAGIIAYVEK